jgi:hypothetical protein
MFQPYSCNLDCTHSVFPEGISGLLFGYSTQEGMASIWLKICHLHQQLISGPANALWLRSYLRAIYGLIDKSNKRGTPEFKADFRLLWQESCDYLSSYFDPVMLIESESIIELMHSESFLDLLNEPRVITWISNFRLSLIKTPAKRPRIQVLRCLQQDGFVDDSRHHIVPFCELSWVSKLENLMNTGRRFILLHGHLQSGKTSTLKYIEAHESASRKVVYIQASKESANVTSSLDNKGGNFFWFLASKFGVPDRAIPTPEECFLFVQRKKFTKPPMLVIDEFEALIRPENNRHSIIPDLHLFIKKILKDSDRTFHSVIFAGNVTVETTFQEEGSENEELLSLKIDNIDFFEKVFESGSPYNSVAVLATEPFSREILFRFASRTFECYGLNSFDREIIYYIFDKCSGHPGLCYWFIIKVVACGIGHAHLSLELWNRAKEKDIYMFDHSPTLTKLCLAGKKSDLCSNLIKMILDQKESIPQSPELSFLQSIGIAQVTQNNDVIFTCPIVKEYFLKIFYPPISGQVTVLDGSLSPKNAGYGMAVILNALPLLIMRNLLHKNVVLSRGLSEASVHSELCSALRSLYRNQTDVHVLVEARVVPNSTQRADIWITGNNLNFGIEVKTELKSADLIREGIPQMVEYASVEKPSEMILVNFVWKQPLNVEFPIVESFKKGETHFGILNVKIEGDIKNGINLYYASNTDTAWIKLCTH